MVFTQTFFHAQVVYIDAVPNDYGDSVSLDDPFPYIWAKFPEGEAAGTPNNCTRKIFGKQKAGWHIVPTSQYDEWLSYSNWLNLVTNTESFQLKKLSVQISNMQPVIDQVSLGGNETWDRIEQYSIHFGSKKSICDM